MTGKNRGLFIPKNEGRWDNSRQLCKRLLQEGEGHVSLCTGQGIRSLRTSKGDLELWDRGGLGLIAGRRGRVGSPGMEFGGQMCQEGLKESGFIHGTGGREDKPPPGFFSSVSGGSQGNMSGFWDFQSGIRGLAIWEFLLLLIPWKESCGATQSCLFQRFPCHPFSQLHRSKGDLGCVLIESWNRYCWKGF